MIPFYIPFFLFVVVLAAAALVLIPLGAVVVAWTRYGWRAGLLTALAEGAAIALWWVI